MRDSRFAQQGFVDQIANRKRDALAIEVPKKLERRVLGAIEEFWASSPEPTSEALLHHFNKATENIDPLVGALVHEVRAVLAKVNHGGALPSNLADRAGIIVGKALGQSLAAIDSPSPEAYDQARSVVENTDLGAMEIDNALLDACANSLGKRRAWTAALSAVPSDLSGYLMSYQREQKELVEGLKRESITRPTQLWGGLYGRASIDWRVLRRFSLLGRLSPATMLESLEAIPSVGIRHSLMESLRLFEDLDLVAQGLRELPPAYDEHGNWTGKAMPFLMLGSAIQYASALSSMTSLQMGSSESRLLGTPSDSAAKEEISKKLIKIAQIVFSRPSDGFRLGIEFSTELVRKTIMERGVRSAFAWDAEVIARDIWVEFLIDRSCRFSDIENAFNLTKSGDQTSHEEPYLLLAALLDHIRRNPDDPKSVPPDAGEPDRVWDWYVRCLRDSSSDIRHQVNTYNTTRPWVLYVLASSLAVSSDVCECWNKAWNQLYPQRQAARFKPDTWWNLDSSRHLLRVGRTIFEFKLVAGASGPGRRFWRELCQKEVQFHIAHPPLAPRTDFPEIASLLGLAGHVMGGEWGTALDDSVPLFIADGLVAVATSWVLIKNGLSVEEVDSKFQSMGCDLVALAEANEEWRTRLGRALPAGMNIREFVELFHHRADSRSS